MVKNKCHHEQNNNNKNNAKKPTTQHTHTQPMLKAQRTNENVSQMNDNKSGKK